MWPSDLGDPHWAIDYHRWQLEISQEIGDLTGEGNALWDMATQFHALGERVQAIGKGQAPLLVYEETHDPNGDGARVQLARCRGEQGQDL